MKKQVLKRVYAPPSKKRSVLFFSILFSVSLLLSNNLLATVTTHELQSSFKGYSIENLNGNEFVVAGTYYKDDNGTLTTGYHYMHLDVNGKVISNRSVVVVPNGDMELRVVDIAVQSNNSIWVTMAARDNAAAQDFIYAENIDISGNLLGTRRAEGWLSFGFEHFYPTHSLVNEEGLYVCGYASDQQVSSTMPTNVSSNKVGIIVEFEFNANPLTHIFKWDTSPTTVHDFDMGLRMRFAGDYFLVTGAANQGSNEIAGTLVLKVHKSFLAQFSSGTVLKWTTNQNFPVGADYGWFGTDLYQDGQDLYVLCNQFQYNTVMRWSVARVDANTLNSAPGVPNIMGVAGATIQAGWAKQFYPDPNNSANGVTNLAIIGEQKNPILGCATPPQFNPPSINNINPFVSTYSLSYTAGSGISWTNNSYFIHASDLGTTANNLDHITTTNTVFGTDLEDEQRLHTPAAGFVTGQTNEIAIMAPMQNPSNPDHLNTKFLRVDAQGNENTCHNQWTCQPRHASGEVAQYIPVHALSAWSYQDLQPTGYTSRSSLVPIEDDCQGGIFKPAPTSVANIENGSGISIFPNPTTKELNIKVANTQGETLKFTLTDITGKKVISKEQELEHSTVNIKLPNLNPGVYIGIVELNNEQYTEKIIIE